MCGILGLYQHQSNKTVSAATRRGIIEALFLESQSRGKDSSGILAINDKKMRMAKHSCNAALLIKSRPFEQAMALETSPYIMTIGHSRMETNGSFLVPENNQPVTRDDVFVIHNGIIVNTDKIWQEFPHLKRQYQVDTEVVTALWADLIKSGGSIEQGVGKLFDHIEGSFSLGIVGQHSPGFLLTTNTGSLYTLSDKKSGFVLFASEELFIRNIQEKFSELKSSEYVVEQLKPGHFAYIDFEKGTLQRAEAKKNSSSTPTASKVQRTLDVLDMSGVESSVPLPKVNNRKDMAELVKEVERGFANARRKAKSLRRCTKCVLPETMPFIRFDESGICNYCYRYQKRELLGVEKLHQVIDDHKKKYGDKIVLSFSGGRDSSFALHYAVKKLGLKPLAFSYDWGMLTDLGRRNQARMIGKLGVEHILVSADIQKKRQNISKNVAAWLKKPVLGLIPLFMAGDKQYFYYLNRVRTLTGIDTALYAENALEKTDFKYGFANVDIGTHFGKGYDIGLSKSAQLAWFYAYHFMANPRYINASILDTLGAYLSSYAVPKQYLYLFNYIPWIEDEITNTLVDEYNWELAPDTKSSWRIGDGTQAFYNYIYYVGSCLTEHDTFRSNQIREGSMDRATALDLIERDNQPRIESLVWYFDVIGLSALDAVKRVNEMNKLPLLVAGQG
jgi:glucosamine--fructose-6-phosphate aminotransferase (isomerizing)